MEWSLNITLIITITVILVGWLGNSFCWNPLRQAAQVFLVALLSSYWSLFPFSQETELQGTALDKRNISRVLLPILPWQGGHVSTVVKGSFSLKRLFFLPPTPHQASFHPYSRPLCGSEQTQKTHHRVKCLANGWKKQTAGWILWGKVC